MNGIRILCDTNPLIYLLDGNRDIARFLDNKQIYLSVITELELFGKPNLSKNKTKVYRKATRCDSCIHSYLHGYASANV